MARLHAYDWRKALLKAKQFMQRLVNDRSKQVAVLGHSMGGLVRARRCRSTKKAN